MYSVPICTYMRIYTAARTHGNNVSLISLMANATYGSAGTVNLLVRCRGTPLQWNGLILIRCWTLGVRAW